MLLAAASAKMRCKEAFFRMRWIENLSIKGDRPRSGMVESCVQTTGARDKLMQFEREERLIATACNTTRPL
jgi:hypothetical protein